MTGVEWLIRFYPRAWRQRYEAEFQELMADLSVRTDRAGRWRTIVDIGRGAFDAHRREGFGMRRTWVDPALRRGILDGMVIAALIAVDVVMTNIIFPPGPGESDSDPEYLWSYLATLAVIAALFIAIGARARRRRDTPTAGLLAGTAAGVVVALLVTLTFVAVNNLFLGIVSQQHDKRVAFAASGWTSMRAYLTVTQLGGALILVPVLAVFGAVLGLLGATVFRARPGTVAAPADRQPVG
jgi:uncharacterized membrane protein YhaH (DUF805 family)